MKKILMIFLLLAFLPGVTFAENQVRGFPNRANETRTPWEGSTVSPASSDRAALDVACLASAQVVTAGAVVAAGTTTSVIQIVGHSAIVGDLILFTSGALNRQEYTVVNKTADTITLGQSTPTAAAAGVTFDILRYAVLRVDSSGNLLVVPSTASAFGAAFPANGIAAGFSDGTNMQSPRVFDLDSGAGTQYGLGCNLRQVAGGGSVEAGILATPLRIDPTGTTTQPVSGTVTANQGTANATPWNVNTAQVNGITTLTGNGVTGTGSQRVTIASDNSALAVSQSGTWNINNVSGVVSLPTGASTSAKQPALGTAGVASADVITVQGIAAMTALKVDGSAVTQPVSGTVTSNQGTANATPWNVNTAQVNGITTLTGNGVTGTGSQRVTIASDNTAFPIKLSQAGTDNDVDIASALPAGANAIGSVNVNNGAGASGAVIQGQVGHNGAVAGSPVFIGGEARSTEITAVTSGNISRMITDLTGRQVVMPYQMPGLFVNGKTGAFNSGAAQAIIASAGGGTRNYLTQCSFSNTNAATSTTVDLLDGLTILATYNLPSNSNVIVEFPTPLKGSQATAFNCQTAAAVANCYCNCSGFTSAP